MTHLLDKEPIEVQRAWLEGLIRLSTQLNRNKNILEVQNIGHLHFLADLAQLQGYIESAKYLIGEKPYVRQSNQRSK